MDPNTQRAEAERWLGIAAKLLTARDFLGSKTFAIRAREADPNNAVSDQFLAVVDTVLAGEKRVNTSQTQNQTQTQTQQQQQQPDWYAVLQLPRLVRDPDLIANHYRRLVMLLNPEHNRLPFADYALQLAMEAWSVLSDPTKKWLFDNELALHLQRASTAHQQIDPGMGLNPGSGSAQVSAQLNTFQFFQPQPQQQPPPNLPMWQQQPPRQQNQMEFMAAPPTVTVPQPSVAVPQAQQLLPQWQMRDPTPAKGGERSKGSGLINNGGGGNGSRGGAATTSSPPPSRARATMAPPPMVGRASVPAPIPTPTPGPIPMGVPVVSPSPMAPPPPREVSTGGVVHNHGSSYNNDNNDYNVNVNVNVEGGGGENVNNDHDGVVEEEEVESFWTACPYCFYLYEYQKMYQECTLRCQNCKRGFHAVQIPNPPPVGPAKGNGKDNKEEKENSFCCWGFFPLGFSMTAWKKHNQGGNMNGSSNWVPFSPMFACPTGNGGGNFQWFNSNGNATVGPRNVGRGNVSAPRVYIDDELEDVLDISDTSNSDSSDGDWRNRGAYMKKKKSRRGRMGKGQRGRPRRSDRLNPGNQDSIRGGGVSVGGEGLEDGSSTQEVVFGLVAGNGNGNVTKADASRNVASTITRKQTRRSVKDMGRLDLNVEFNNEVDEHAPTVSAVNGEEDGIENIAFFEGLDEFLSTLPILNVGGDEKAKPS